MKPGDQILLDSLLTCLKLPTIKRDYSEASRQAESSGAGFETYLLDLLSREHEQRQANQLTRRLRAAAFPQMKPLEETDLTKWPGFDARTIKRLADGGYIADKENVILIGKHGTGKTHAAIALGIEACRQGRSVCFTTAAALVNQLTEARDERHLRNLLTKLRKVRLLILDELGYIPFSQDGARLLFQVLSERYEQASTLITTNLNFSDWTQIFGDENLTAALLDRITHHCHIHTFDWESVRFTESMRRRDVTT